MRIAARILGVLIILALCTYGGVDRYKMQMRETAYEHFIDVLRLHIYHQDKVIERLEKHQCNDASGLRVRR